MTLWATRRSAQILEELDLGEFEGKAGESLRKELTDELISLARKYGVLTPYTSFLAMEDQDLNRTDENFRQAVTRLGLMGETSGRGAIRSRGMRGSELGRMSLSRSDMDFKARSIDAFELHSSPPPLADFVARMTAEGISEEARERIRQIETKAIRKNFTRADLREIGVILKCSRSGGESPGNGASGSPVAGTGFPAGDRVQPETIGGRTFFRKGGVLVEGDLNDDELKAAKEVKQFSEEYFRLAAELPAEGLGWLSQDTSLVFRWKGEVYRILPLTEKPVASKTKNRNAPKTKRLKSFVDN
ncbi:MAG: hypothetical protein LBR80_08985 [Deltaproteobacteria bacterium]|jgi:Ca-activated chloride channel family protein|nr:hypothetical protein [Deltaproteobacteria bacterium]